MTAMSEISNLESSTSPYNAAHHQALRCANDAALWASVSGLELMSQRATLSHGEWGKWVEANCDFTVRTATNYLAAAERAVAHFGSAFPIQEQDHEAIKNAILDLIARSDSESRTLIIAALR